jgi:hypothetical protein
MTLVFAACFSAPLILNMWTPLPDNVIGPEPMFAAPLMQYTPGGYTFAGYWTFDPRSIAPFGNVTVHFVLSETASAIERAGILIMTEGPVDTVPPNAKTLPVMLVLPPIVTPDASSIVPAKLLLAPSVVALVGTQSTSDACAPLASFTLEFATVVSAPRILKV